jgi:DNA polymerase-3 subunit epsilon
MTQSTPLADAMFTVVDCETTGFSAESNRVIQIGAVIVSGSGTIHSTFDTIVRPECPDTYEHAAEHVHGISAEHVSNGMPLRQALAKLLEFGAMHTFVAHNAPFDIGFLRSEATRVNMSEVFESWLCRYVDTVQLSRRIDCDRLRSHKLGSLCEHYGIDPGTAHEALSDATATARLLPLLLSDLGLTTTDHIDELVGT